MKKRTSTPVKETLLQVTKKKILLGAALNYMNAYPSHEAVYLVLDWHSTHNKQLPVGESSVHSEAAKSLLSDFNFSTGKWTGVFGDDIWQAIPDGRLSQVLLELADLVKGLFCQFSGRLHNRTIWLSLSCLPPSYGTFVDITFRSNHGSQFEKHTLQQDTVAKIVLICAFLPTSMTIAKGAFGGLDLADGPAAAVDKALVK